MSIGVVVENNDPLKLNRIKASILDVYGDIPIDNIPWAYPRFTNIYNTPSIGEYVSIDFVGNDILHPIWALHHGLDNQILLKSKTLNNAHLATILDSKDLSKYGFSGVFNIYYDYDSGFFIEMTTNDTSNSISMLNDGSIKLSNKKHNIHLTNSGISLGSKDKSKDVGVYGNINKEVLELLNTFINKTCEIVENSAKEIAKVSSATPITSPMAPLFTKMQVNIAKLKSEMFDKINSKSKETLSDIVTLD